jgi:hypothetical protein
MYAVDFYTHIYTDEDRKSPLHYHNDVLVQHIDIHIAYDWAFLPLPFRPFPWLHWIDEYWHGQ